MIIRTIESALTDGSRVYDVAHMEESGSQACLLRALCMAIRNFTNETVETQLLQRSGGPLICAAPFDFGNYASTPVLNQNAGRSNPDPYLGRTNRRRMVARKMIRGLSTAAPWFTRGST